MNSTSVKNRILQFQTQSCKEPLTQSSNNSSVSHNSNHNCRPVPNSSATNTSASSVLNSNFSSNRNNILTTRRNSSSNSGPDSYIANDLNGLHFNSISNNCFLSTHNNNIPTGRSAFVGKMNHHSARSPSPSNAKIGLTQSQSIPPTLQAKKASMTINLSSSNDSNAVNNNNMHFSTVTNPPRAKPRTPTKNPSFSSIPKPTGVQVQTARSPITNTTRGIGSAPHSNKAPPNTQQSVTLRVQRTHTSPNILHNNNNGGGTVKQCSLSPMTTSPTTPTGFGSSTGRFYGAIGWKDKYEESEKKRMHVVTLAQKATRDYEELRRRYQELYAEHEKLLHKFEGATGQLDSLRKASEAAYAEYYKLKKKYEVENNAKSEALSRVDQYNRENRRLKRASALMMQQISDPSSFADGIIQEVVEEDCPDNDKEIKYLRDRVQELESKIVDLESELEKIAQAEFETQESVLLMNDAVQSSKSENARLKEQLRKLDEENRRLQVSLDDTIVEFESLKTKYNVDEEKLLVAETELKKLLNEKNILQRQSMVFLSDAMDNRLLDALNQIGDLQTALEEQKNASEAQMIELRNQLQEKENHEETSIMQTDEKIKSLEEEIIKLHKRAEEAEKKLEEISISEQSSSPLPPPPPPMPNFMTGPPPPPPPPMPASSSLNSSLNSTMRTLKRVNTSGSNSDAASASSTPPNGMEGQPKSLPQIDDVISQIRKGVKLKPMDRTLSRKPTEVAEKQPDSAAVEDLRFILNNLRRTQRL